MPNIIVWDQTPLEIKRRMIESNITRALIVARDGSFQLKRIALAGQVLIEAVVKIGPGWVEEGMVDWGEPSLRLGFAEKIPQAVLQQAIAFFQTVYTRHQSEAIVLLFYAPSGPDGRKWMLMAPPQEVTGAACHYDDPGPAPAGWFLAGTIHSHGSMGAFHSGTDDRDEDNRDGIHITVGGVNSLPNFAVSAVIDGSRFKLELADVVEGIAQTTFPEAWLGRVTKPALVVPLASSWLSQQSHPSDPSSDGEEEAGPVIPARSARSSAVLQRRGGKKS